MRWHETKFSNKKYVFVQNNLNLGIEVRKANKGEYKNSPAGYYVLVYRKSDKFVLWTFDKTKPTVSKKAELKKVMNWLEVLAEQFDINNIENCNLHKVKSAFKLIQKELS